MERWVGKVALVTGASSGIGASIAEELVKAGLNVVAVARRVAKLEALAKSVARAKGKLYPQECDVTSEESILKVFAWIKKNLGGVDVLINNAGVAAMGVTLSDGPTAEFRRVIDTNVVGLVICTREAIKSMKERNVDGHIIHINSVFGHYVPKVPGMNLLSATKHAVTALTETLRQELIDDKSKIKVTSVSPGAVKTEAVLGPDGKPWDFVKDNPFLDSVDIANGVLYVLGTPAHVQVHELTIRPIGENF